ncbi:hypothetical protein Tco_0657651 [Tanacetum coccineum]
MAGLDFCSKHNMVAYMEKNDGNTKTVNNISYIDVIVASKPMTISEASIRSDLLFDDVDGIDTLNNQAIFDTIQLMGSKSTSWDQIPSNIATAMICLATNQKYNFSKLIFDEDEDEVSKRPSESQPIPSPTHPSKDQPESQPDSSPRPSSSIPIPDFNPDGSGGNHGAQIKHLKKKVRPVINHHKAWFRAARLKKQQKKKDMEKSKKRRSVSKQGRKCVKSSKGAPSVHTHTDWDAMDIDLEATLNDAMDYTLTQDEGKTEQQSTIKPDKGTDKQNEGTDRTKLSTDNFIEEKEKGVELKDVEDIERPRPTSTRSLLTLKPLPKIDLKAKGKGKVEEDDESDTKSEYITKAEKKFKMLANDEEMARKVQEEWEAEEEKKRLAEEEATKTVFTNEYDFIQARLNADKILAEKL